MKKDVFQVHWIVLAMAVTAICVSLYKYYAIEHYTFLIEADCDPAAEQCFVRDCEEDCPPNQLSSYKSYAIPARTFGTCTDNSCTHICPGSQCEEIMCDEAAGDMCSTPDL